MQKWLFFNVFTNCSDDLGISWFQCLLYFMALVFFLHSCFWMLFINSSFIYLGKFLVTEVWEFLSFILLHLNFLVLIEVSKFDSSWFILFVLIHHFFLNHWIPKGYGHFPILQKIAIVIMAINHFLYFPQRFSILIEGLVGMGRVGVFLGAYNDNRLPYFGIFIFGLV